MPENDQQPGAADAAAAQGAKPDLTDDQKKDIKLTKENQSLRTRLREIEGKVSSATDTLKKLGVDSLDDLSTFVEEFEKKSTTSRNPAESEAELARLKRTVENINKQLDTERTEKLQLTEKSKAKTRDSLLSRLLLEAQVLHPEHALELLRGKAKVEADDAVLLATKDGEEEATVEVIKKLLPPIFFPPQGATGSGSKAPGNAGKSFSLENLQNMTLSEFEKHKSEIRALLSNSAKN